MVIEDDRRTATLPAFAPCEFRIKRADSAWEIGQARALRRAVFCDEQRLFSGDDTDSVDAANPRPQTLVAVSALAGMPDQVVGTVRLHVAEGGDSGHGSVWWGSRLAVARCHRHVGRIGTTLIALAVRSAHAQGCRLFLAHVQAQNVTLFQRLHWRHLRDEQQHGRAHALMQADLGAYPPCHDPLTGLVTRST